LILFFDLLSENVLILFSDLLFHLVVGVLFAE